MVSQMSTFVYAGWVGGQCNVYVDIFSFYTSKYVLKHFSHDTTFKGNMGVFDESDVHGNREAK